MKGLDLVALGGLLICAIAMGTGLLAGNGTLQFVGSFFGWFLAAYSSLRYVIQAVLFGLRTEVSLWGTVIPVNFALALIGVAVFGIHDWEAAKLAMAVFAGAMIVGFVSATVSIANSRYAPLGVLVVLALPFYEKFSPFWTHIYVAVASSLLAVGIVEFAKHGVGSREAGPISK
jgi:hypothetical protein